MFMGEAGKTKRLSGQDRGPGYEKGGPGSPRTALRMVSGQRTAAQPLSAKRKITDNAPHGSFPTSLLNHETSDHLLSRLESRTPRFTVGQARVHRWPVTICESG